MATFGDYPIDELLTSPILLDFDIESGDLREQLLSLAPIALPLFEPFADDVVGR